MTTFGGKYTHSGYPGLGIVRQRVSGCGAGWSAEARAQNGWLQACCTTLECQDGQNSPFFASAAAQRILDRNNLSA